MIQQAVNQPGPRNPVRIDSLAGECRYLEFVIEAGKCLRDALVLPLKAAGINGATVRIEGLVLQSFSCVRPSLPKDDQHAAYYSDPHAIDHAVTIKLAVATTGRKNGEPFVHCHAIWNDETRGEQGGHLLTDHVVVAEPVNAMAFGLADAAMQVDFDDETNFSLFHPVQVTAHPTQSEGANRCAIARIRPNEDLCGSIEAVCARHGFEGALIRGSIGSIAGAQFTDGRSVRGIATEILVVDGKVSASPSGLHCHLDIAVIDTSGKVHRGTLARGVNPVLICFELVLEEVVVAKTHSAPLATTGLR